MNVTAPFSVFIQYCDVPCLISGPIFSVKPECSNPCQYNKAVESHEDLKLKLAGKFVHKCRWSDCEVRLSDQRTQLSNIASEFYLM